MITDKLTIFSGSVSSAGAIAGQAIGGAASVVSTNSYDTGPRAIGSNQPVKLGAGEPLKVIVNVRVAPATCTSVAFQLIQADDAALTSNVQVLVDNGTIAIASLVAGTNIELPFRRPDPLAAKRYVGVRYVITGTDTTSGTYFAAMVADFADVQTSYKSGFLVS